MAMQDPRTSERSGDADGAVAFDMVPIDDSSPARVAHPAPPVDVVLGVDPSAELPLSEPEVHPPIGSGVSQLEAALSRLSSTASGGGASPQVGPSPPHSASSPVPPAASSPVATPPSPATTSSPNPPPPPPQGAAAPSLVAASAVETSPAAPAPVAPALAHPGTATPPPPSPPSSPAIVALPPSAPSDRAAALVEPPVAPSPAPVLAAPVLAAPDGRDPAALLLPEPTNPTSTGAVGAPPAAPVVHTSAQPMLPFRLVGAVGISAALVLSAWQAVRVFNGQEWFAVLSWAALVAAAIGSAAVVGWTWVVTANARRVIAPAWTQELPDPGHAALTWVVPFVYVAGASASVTYLSNRFHSPGDGATSAVPFVLALVAMILCLPMMYSPVTYLSSVVRKVGGRGIRFAEWIWVSVALAAVGALMIAGLRFGGAFGDDVDGLAPAWVIGVASIVPAVVIVLLGWRAGGEVEADVVRAFDRRNGVSPKASRRRGIFSRLSADGGPNHTALRQRGFISLLPGVNVVSLVVSALLGGLALLSLVGGLVMVLFWQETRDGVLLPSQTANAWDLLARLKSIEHVVVLMAVVAATVWSFLAVMNVRLASARRRNPLVAAVAWPVAAGGIWMLNDRFVADGSIDGVIVGLLAQALVLAAPFFLLYRCAGSIGGRRQAIRIAWAVGVILLVHVQGLGGLSTASTTIDSTEVGRFCGYLVIGAVLHLLVMFAAATAMRAVMEPAVQVADRHNSLIAQRRQAEVSRTKTGGPAPRMDDAEVAEGAMS